MGRFLPRLYLTLLVIFMFLVPLFAQEGTESPVPPTETASPSPTEAPSFTPLPTNTDLPTATLTETATATLLPTDTATASETATETSTATQAEITAEVTELSSPEVTAEVTEVASEIATATSSATATSTSTSTATNTAIPSHDEQYITIDSYDAMAVMAGLWEVGDNWQFVEREGSTWISTGSQDIIETWRGLGRNTMVETTFTLPAGSLTLTLRQSASGSYRLVLDSTGTVSLWRGELLVSSNITMPLGISSHKIMFYAYEGQIFAELDENLILLYSDINPLPAGMIGLSLLAADGFLIKELTVNMSEFEYDEMLASIPTSLYFESPHNIAPSISLQSFGDSGEDYSNSIVFHMDANTTKPTRLLYINMNCALDILNPCPSEQISFFAPTTQAVTVSSYPVWSPDRTQIAFIHRGVENNFVRFLYVMQTNPISNLQEARRLTGLADVRRPTWSPDGTKIAVSDPSEIYIIDFQACSLGSCSYWNWTNTPTISETNPTWSPDGTKIAFEAIEASNDREIYIMNIDGTGRTPITNNSSTDRDPEWSPDGSQIVYASYKDLTTGTELYIYTLSTHADTRLTFDGQWSLSPSWSPTGTMIAYYQGTIANLASKGDIFVIDLTSNIDPIPSVRITSDDGYGNHSPDWGLGSVK